jgi:hypothetical protein
MVLLCLFERLCLIGRDLAEGSVGCGAVGFGSERVGGILPCRIPGRLSGEGAVNRLVYLDGNLGS